MKYTTAGLLGIAAANDQRYMMHLALFGKSYATIEEYEFRKAIFDRNMDAIEAHNAKEDETFSMGPNKFSDWTDSEFNRLLGYKSDQKVEALPVRNETDSAWGTKDWRSMCAGVKDQGHCGSCWSFSTTGSLEACYAIHHQQKVSLSEQQLIDCS